MARSVDQTLNGLRTPPSKPTKAKQDGPAHVVTDHYKDVEIKKALEKLFHNKCAYCEGQPTSQGPWDVEHYRPKGRVKENSNHPGYYWLAYTWDNLLPSCTFCNQRRIDQATWDDPVAGPAAGKLDQYPLLDEQDRAMDPDSDLDKEKPLLLNPCIDQDCETFFRYDIQGHILPAESGNLRAEKTIKICHLERRRLRQDRAELMRKVIKAVELHEMSLGLNNAELMQKTRELVDLFTTAISPFAGTAKFVDRNRHAFIVVQQ